jgi:hypothetical protein
MARIVRFEQFPRELKQSHPLGCIPTNIAAILQWWMEGFGMPKDWITEQAVTEAYDSTTRLPRSFGSFEKVNVLSRLTFKPEGSQKERSLSDFLVLKSRGFQTFDEWWKHIADCIDTKRWPISISYTREDDPHPHVCTVLCVNGHKLEICDSSTGTSTIPTERSDLESLWPPERPLPHLNHDIMEIQPK